MIDITPQYTLIPAEQEFVFPQSFQDQMAQTVGGMQAGSQSLDYGGVHVQGTSQRILMGSATDPTTGTGIFMGSDGAATIGYDFRVGDPAGNYIFWDASAGTLTISGSFSATTGAIGGFNIGTDYIRDAANSFGLASTVTGGDDVRFWAGAAFASRATAPFRVTEAGAVVGSNFTHTGGSINGVPISGIPNDTSTDISLLEKTHNIVFSVTDADTIAWASGTINLSNGRTFSISSGNTGNMAALTYIYLDPAVSSTVLQTTTTYSTAVGANKVLLGVAQNNTVTASFIPYGPGQALVDGSQIGALSIVAGNIAASTITAAKLTVSQLSAISADLGAITAGSIVLPSSGFIRSGQTAYATGTGFYLGNDSGTPKFSIGSATSYLTWDGTILAVTDSAIINTFVAQEDITVGDAVCIGDGSTINTEPYSGVGSATNITTTDWISQLYPTIVGSITITRVIIALAATVDGNYSITVSIRADSAGQPTGPDLVSKTQSCALVGAQTSVNFDFASAMTSTSATNYHIIVRRAGAEGNTVSVGRDNNGAQGTYTSTDSGSTWSASNGGIRLEVSETDSVAGQLSKTSAASTHARANNFIGFAYETKSAGNNCRVALAAVATGLSGLSPGSTYYLSNTLGAIATSAGSASRKIGVALSSTSLLIKHDNV
jgi:hypothetical protein